MNILKRIYNNLLILGNKDLNLIYNKNTNQLSININKNIELNITGNLSIRVNGQINLITENNTMGLDTINSQLYLNSRVGDVFNEDPEAIEYKRRLQEQLVKEQLETNKFVLEELKKCPE